MGKRDQEDGESNRFLEAFMALCRLVAPPVLLLENVHQCPLSLYESLLGDMYVFSTHVLSPTTFGIPQ